MAKELSSLGSVAKRANRTEIAKLVESQEYRCALSGMELDPATAQLDHKYPVTLGGDHSIGNLQVVNKEINRAKGAMTNEDFIGMCRRVTAWNA
jgi:hypothetical protein